MRTRTKSKLFKAARAVALTSPLVAVAAAYASINGPYGLDGNTVMLYHLDEAPGGSTAADAQTLSANAFSINQTSTTVAGGASTAVLGQTGFTGFGNAATFSAGLCLGYDGNGVAAVYAGGNTAGNVRLYWTKLDPSNTYAHLLGTGLSNGTVSSGNNPIVIGNKGRWNNLTSEAFTGLIDEVRISNTARNAYQMM